MPTGSVDGGDPRSPLADGGDPRLRLATWNVNSIRIRLDRVVDWMARADVDVLAMQETKCSDGQFPALPFYELGYEVAHVGFNQWNGVAIASRVVSTGTRRTAKRSSGRRASNATQWGRNTMLNVRNVIRWNT